MINKRGTSIKGTNNNLNRKYSKEEIDKILKETKIIDLGNGFSIIEKKTTKK